MKIYFTATSTNKQLKVIYKQIVKWFEAQGHEVYSKALGDRLPRNQDISGHQIKGWVKEWTECINECDLVVIEGSYPSSIHVGFEVGVSLMKGKPTVLLCQRNKNPVLIDQAFSNRLIKSEYDQDDLIEVLEWCLEEADKVSSRRFTFYIDSKIDTFLDKVGDKEDKSRSEYIRDLIKKEMKKPSSR